jgi:hypothetical protein
VKAKFAERPYRHFGE